MPFGLSVHLFFFRMKHLVGGFGWCVSGAIAGACQFACLPAGVSWTNSIICCCGLLGGGSLTAWLCEDVDDYEQRFCLVWLTACLTFRQSSDQFRSSDIRTDGLCQFVWLPELLCCCCCCCCYWVSVVWSAIDRPTDGQTDERIDRASKRVSWAITVANQAASQLLIVLWVGNVCWFRWTRAFYCFLAVFIYLFFSVNYSRYIGIFSYGADQPQMFSTNANIFARRM